jgi:hypothetical protein
MLSLKPVLSPTLVRFLAVLGLAACFMPGLAVPALADDPEIPHRPSPDERLQIVTQSVRVIDDQDWWGAGELRLYWELTACPVSGAIRCDAQPLLRGAKEFDGASGATVELGLVVPQADDANPGANISEATGIGVVDDERYLLHFEINEQDLGSLDWDHLGSVDLLLDASNNWGLGAHTDRASKEGGAAGDFSITYQIRRTPLPDLFARGIRQIGEGDQAFFCVAVQNIGEQPSEQFPLTVRVDGAILRTLDPMAALEPGETGEHCTYRPELPAKEHMLTFAVDESRRVAEMSESNNRYEWKIPALQTSAAASAQTAAEPRTALADLRVTEIRVRGEKASGPRDCDPGKNDVTVEIANAGGTSDTAFAVRLVVDNENDDARERTVQRLESGTELEIRFDDVSLGRGERRLSATVDAKKAIAESDEDNNEMKLTVNCRDD